MKSYPGPPMTLGKAAAVRVWLIVWCRDCSRQVEPEPAEIASRYGAEIASRYGAEIAVLRARLIAGTGTPPSASA